MGSAFHYQRARAPFKSAGSGRCRSTAQAAGKDRGCEFRDAEDGIPRTAAGARHPFGRLPRRSPQTGGDGRDADGGNVLKPGMRGGRVGASVHGRLRKRTGSTNGRRDGVRVRRTIERGECLHCRGRATVGNRLPIANGPHSSRRWRWWSPYPPGPRSSRCWWWWSPYPSFGTVAEISHGKEEGGQRRRGPGRHEGGGVEVGEEGTRGKEEAWEGEEEGVRG